MDQVYIIHNVDLITPLTAIVMFCLGWFKSGAFLRMVFRIAEMAASSYAQSKAQEWLDSPPGWVVRLEHAFGNHGGVNSKKCQTDRCKHLN